jgi:metallo-beta-lactamase family protein
MRIKFLGAAREVTGSKYLITTDSGKKLLLDCGMFQGKGLETDAMNRDLGFEPEMIDNIILTHAHIDHSGLIPYMYKLGFRGSVVCTNCVRSCWLIQVLSRSMILILSTREGQKRDFPLLHPFLPGRMLLPA